MVRRIGIVGHEEKKFTPEAKLKALEIIASLIGRDTTVVSGHCHLGGVDIWAEIEADFVRCPKLIFPPKTKSWETGYKPRNIKIAENCDEIHVIVVKSLPEGFKGMKFPKCYHCNTTSHVKSGGCWTAKYAQKLGKPAYWHEV